MKYLVDANVLSEATKPAPAEKVVEWLRQNEAEFLIDPIILGEIRFGIHLLPASKRRERLEECLKQIYGMECRLGSYLQQTEIQEIADSPNSDEVVVLSESAPSHGTLAAAYARFAERLAGGKLPWEP